MFKNFGNEYQIRVCGKNPVKMVSNLQFQFWFDENNILSLFQIISCDDDCSKLRIESNSKGIKVEFNDGYKNVNLSNQEMLHIIEQVKFVSLDQNNPKYWFHTKIEESLSSSNN